VVAQERVPGEVVAIAALAHEGDVRAAFQYRRLHQVPTSGGASSYRISEALDPKLAGYVSRFLGPLSWTGVAMVEFIVDGDDAWLIEVNGRLWGSLALPVAAGADFPTWLAELMLFGRLNFPSYRTGVRCRALDKEVAWLKAVVRRDPGAPGLGVAIADSARAVSPKERWDGYASDDPIPGITEAASVVDDLYDTARRMVRARLVRAQMAARRRLRLWRGARTALFVCDGNIIRSVYSAALYAERHPEVEVRSAGLEARAGRPPHENTVARAATRGLDVSGSAASPVDRPLLDASDVVFVMTLEQALRLRDQFGDHPNLVLLDDVDIIDPDGTAQATFDRVFDQVERAVERL
jgi:protein-tyrosine-phosphatase